MGQSRPSNSASGLAFVGYAPDSDRRRCNAANAATCHKQTFESSALTKKNPGTLPEAMLSALSRAIDLLIEFVI